MRRNAHGCAHDSESLCSLRRQDCHWVTTITGDKSAIKVSPGVYKTFGQLGLPGSGGVTVWTITGKAGGKAKITFGTVPPGGTAAQYEVAETITVH